MNAENAALTLLPLLAPVVAASFAATPAQAAPNTVDLDTPQRARDAACLIGGTAFKTAPGTANAQMFSDAAVYCTIPMAAISGHNDSFKITGPPYVIAPNPSTSADFLRFGVASGYDIDNLVCGTTCTRNNIMYLAVGGVTPPTHQISGTPPNWDCEVHSPQQFDCSTVDFWDYDSPGRP